MKTFKYGQTEIDSFSEAIILDSVKLYICGFLFCKEKNEKNDR